MINKVFNIFIYSNKKFLEGFSFFDFTNIIKKLANIVILENFNYIIKTLIYQTIVQKYF